MKKRLVKFLCSLFAAVLLLPLFPVAALSYDSVPEIDSSYGVLYNLETEETLFEKNMDARLNPAAFTKLMTALLSFEYRQSQGNLSVTVTEEMLSSAGGTTMHLKVGEVISLDALLQGLVVQNANDAALVLASAVGGNISSFVEQMNQRAKEMGMEHTYYANPTGVDAAVMYTTLRDTLTLCRRIYRVNDFMVLSECPKVTIPATNLTEERVYTNKNALIPYSYVTDYYMQGARGMAAGYTPGAGYCVATTRQKGNTTNLVILSGGNDRSEAKNGTDISSYRDAKILLEWAETNFSIREVLAENTVICEKKVRLAGSKDHMILVSGSSLRALLPIEFNLAEEITTEIRTDEETFTAPIVKGQRYGEMDLIYQGEVLGTVPLTAQSNIGLSRWLVLWDAVVRFFSHGPAKVFLILAICAAVLYVVILIGSVWLHYLRDNRARNQAIAEMNERENRRLEKVRQEERKLAQAKLKQARTFFREGFRVLTGDADVIGAEGQTPKRKKKTASSGRAVAKVPEKYRKQNRTRPAVPQGREKQARPAMPSAGQGRDRNTVQKRAQNQKRPATNPREVYRVERRSAENQKKPRPHQKRPE